MLCWIRRVISSATWVTRSGSRVIGLAELPEQVEELQPRGKYVPPKKGFRSGVAATVIGQPPLPVSIWTAFM